MALVEGNRKEQIDGIGIAERAVSLGDILIRDPALWIERQRDGVLEINAVNGDGDDAATLSLVSGGLRVITGAMAKTNPENYKVRTPVALMGVRGTEFAIMLCGDDICDEEEMLGD